MDGDALETMTVRNEPYHQLMAYRLKTLHDRYLSDAKLFRDAVFILMAQLWGEMGNAEEFKKIDRYQRMNDFELWYELGKLCRSAGYTPDQKYGASSSFEALNRNWRIGK